MNNHNLIIFDFNELYKILIEIKKHINFNFEKVDQQHVNDLNLKSNCLISKLFLNCSKGWSYILHLS